MIHFPFLHDWRVARVELGEGQNFLGAHAGMTRIYYVCKCGSVKTKDIMGHWSLDEIRGKYER